MGRYSSQKEESMKKLLFPLIVIGSSLLLSACTTTADVASSNISTAADQFEINRRIVFYNGITNEYILEIDGYCSLGNNDPPKELSVTCKTGDNQYKKHFLGLSDNVTYFAEQLDSAGVNTNQYRVIFKPTTIVPNIEIK